MSYDRFVPICPKCGREGHFPKDCPWAILRITVSQARLLGRFAILSMAVPMGSAVLVIRMMVLF